MCGKLVDALISDLVAARVRQPELVLGGCTGKVAGDERLDYRQVVKRAHKWLAVIPLRRK